MAMSVPAYARRPATPPRRISPGVHTPPPPAAVDHVEAPPPTTVPQQGAGTTEGQAMRQICGDLLHPAPHPALWAVAQLAPDQSIDDPYVKVSLNCQLEAGHAGPHYDLVFDVRRTPDCAWVGWRDGRACCALVLPDCCARSIAAADGEPEPCLLFAGHAGRHSWSVTDPTEQALTRQDEPTAAQFGLNLGRKQP